MDTTPAAAVDDGSSEAAKRLERRFVVWDERSLAHQRRRLSFVKYAILAGPAAVLLLAVQAVLFPGGRFAAVLILGELSLLAFALCIPYLRLGRAHDLWITSRVRAQILRREQFLLFAQVGPYLGSTPLQAAQEVERRLVALDKDVGDPVGLLASRNAHQSWRDALEDASPAEVNLPDLPSRAREYVQRRVVEQRQWLIAQRHKHEGRSRRLENLARGVLAAALILAALHLGFLLHPLLSGEAAAAPAEAAAVATPAAQQAEAHEPLEMALLISALWLPAVGSAFVAYKSALGTQRQALSYGYFAEALEPLEMSLFELAGRAYADLQPDDARRFKRLVLDVEQLLSDDLRQWWMNMVIKEPQASA